MKLNALDDIIRSYLPVNSDNIAKHIESVSSINRTRGIEAAFSDPLCKTMRMKGYDAETEVSLAKVDLKQFYNGRESGRLDCYLPEHKTGIEFKAVRMPREKSTRFDIGQILPDYQRLASGKLSYGYIIVLLWGPQVAVAENDAELYRAFHNQMVIDCLIASKADPYFTSDPVKDLAWDTPLGPRGRIHPWARCVKHSTLGIVAISALTRW